MLNNISTPSHIYNITCGDYSQVIIRNNCPNDDIIVNGAEISAIKDDISEEDKIIREIIETTFKGKKQDNLILSNRYRKIYQYSGEEYYLNKSIRLENCSTYLGFAKIQDRYKMIRTNLCRVRLCPMCAYKRSLSVYHCVRSIYDKINVDYKHSKFLFLTFTVENVLPSDLSKTIDKLNQGFQNIVRQKAFKNISIGTIRTIEITYNKKSHTFHPHIHVIVHTTNELYSGRNYISKKKLTDMWQSAVDINYVPIIDIRRFRANTKRELAEVAKYSVKPNEYLKEVSKQTVKTNEYINETDNVLITLDDVLHKRHLITFSGTFKKAKQDLKIADAEEYDIYKNALEDIEAELIIYKWHFGEDNYIKAVEKLSKAR